MENKCFNALAFAHKSTASSWETLSCFANYCAIPSKTIALHKKLYVLSYLRSLVNPTIPFPFAMKYSFISLLIFSTTKVFQANTKFIWGKPKVCKQIQNFTGERQSFVREHKKIFYHHHVLLGARQKTALSHLNYYNKKKKIVNDNNIIMLIKMTGLTDLQFKMTLKASRSWDYELLLYSFGYF